MILHSVSVSLLLVVIVSICKKNLVYENEKCMNMSDLELIHQTLHSTIRPKVAMLSKVLLEALDEMFGAQKHLKNSVKWRVKIQWARKWMLHLDMTFKKTKN